MRNHLDGRPQVIPPSFLGDHLIVDLSRRGVVLAGHADVEETLVVPKVEVRFSPVVGDVDFAMLEGVHRSRIDVDVRVELLNCYAQAARLQKQSEGCRGDSFAQRRDHSPCDKDKLDILPGHGFLVVLQNTVGGYGILYLSALPQCHDDPFHILRGIDRHTIVLCEPDLDRRAVLKNAQLF